MYTFVITFVAKMMKTALIMFLVPSQWQ